MFAPSPTLTIAHFCIILDSNSAMNPPHKERCTATDQIIVHTNDIENWTINFTQESKQGDSLQTLHLHDAKSRIL